MYTYFYRILDKYQKPIVAYAIFTEANSKERPNHFAIDFMGTSLRYTFNTYKIASQSDEALQAGDNILSPWLCLQQRRHLQVKA